VTAESLRDLFSGHRPSASWVGVGLAAVTAPTMPLLARAKRRVGHALGSSATVSEANQNQLRAYLSVALLAGGPGGGTCAAVAVREGRDSWRGDSCDCC
jgi:divalent metal cation (Fe/Co/Zn/Cd) transporter